MYRVQEPLEARSLAVLLDALTVRAEEAVLDVGTGTGAVPRALARRGRPAEATTVAVDSSPRMLALAARVAGVETRQGDATGLPVPTGSVDVATAAWLLHVLPAPDRVRAVAELVRVLRPGGRLGLVVPAAPRSPGQRLLRAAALRAAGGLGAFRVPEDLPALLADHGLRVRRHRRTGLGYLADVVVCTREPGRGVG